ncbi:MAG: hypothetical protein ACK4GC_13820 [Paracoccaceae bacterium]
MRAERRIGNMPLLADLQADMTESPENYEKRLARIEESAERCRLWFAEHMPDASIKPCSQQSHKTTARIDSAGMA